MATAWRAFAAAAAFVVLAAPAMVRADVRTVLGERLVLVDAYASGRARIVIVSRDATPGAIHVGAASGDPADLAGTVHVCPVAEPTNVARFDLPSPWVANDPTLARYENPGAAPGAAGMRLAVVKPGRLLRLVARNLGDGDAASGDDGPDDLVLVGPGGGCSLASGDAVSVELALTDAADASAHAMCARFTVDRAAPRPSGCKVVARTSGGGACGVCGGSTTTTTTSTTTTSTALVPACGAAGPACLGTCPPETPICATLDGACVCVAGGTPCGSASAIECDGACPEGACLPDGAGCACFTAIPCHLSGFPICGGACDGGGECVGASLPDGTGCFCVPAGTTCWSSAPACGGTCPPGQDCQPSVPGLCTCF
jgi:hypothetical protein